jgi:peptide chain release factor 2
MPIGGYFELEDWRNSIAQLEQLSNNPTFWDDRLQAEELLNKLAKLKVPYQTWLDIEEELDNLIELYALACQEGAEYLEEELTTQLNLIEENFKRYSTLRLLQGEHDSFNCFITIHSGAGGTESNDWVAMLGRMYSRYAEKTGFLVEISDEQADEGGFKSLTLYLTGPYAYGFLKHETGVHRMVRISPFDAAARRHTTFASVYVSADLDETIKIDIKTDDLRIDTYRASGAGGQKVNKTSSAVRITHLPTNIVVQCQNERSQHRNKELAMRMLKSKLYNHYQTIQSAEREQKSAPKADISWGNQVRSYVFQPYTLVKDSRTKIETGNIEAVMNGELEQFVLAGLNHNGR